MVLSSNKKPIVTAIILAAGSGSRMGLDITKQRLIIKGESVLSHTLSAFERAGEIDSVVVVVREDEKGWVENEFLSKFSKIKSIVAGGKTRAESAVCGFSAAGRDSNFVAIHDGARCLITPDMINEVVRMAYQHNAATAVSRISDTLKSVGSDGFVTSTIPRDGVFSATTPQVFSRSIYEQALEGLYADASFTDDNMLVERLGEKIFAVDCGKENIKITTRDDIDYAEYILERRSGMSEIRIGHGYDVHRLVEGRKLVLGGVDVPHTMGLLGHSDADVLTHAIMDAILGACGLGDIGRHFPDSSDEFLGISSLNLLARVKKIISDEGYSVINIDATLVIQKPKVAPYIEEMVTNIAKILDINCSRINIKATTEEKLGFTGREEGVGAHAVVSLKK